jgi:streptomycin 6-kinase
MQKFEQNIIKIYSVEGKKWLADLPYIVNKIAEEWNLSNLKPVANLSYNYVLSGFCDVQPIILKMSLDIEGLKKETKTLQYFKNHNEVKVLEQKDGMILIERAVPGISLKPYFSVNEEKSIEIICDVIRKLHQRSNSHNAIFPHIKEWLSKLDYYLNTISLHDKIYFHLKKAIAIKNQLLQTPNIEFLLHGDLHHDNILQNGNEWCVIDPKGVIGPTAFEITTFIYNPIPDLLMRNDFIEIITNRIDIFSRNFDIAQQTIKQWCFVKAVLCWIWNIEDNLNYTYFAKITEIFNKL